MQPDGQVYWDYDDEAFERDRQRFIMEERMAIQAGIADRARRQIEQMEELERMLGDAEGG